VLGREFESLEPMMQITLNAILRAAFGAQETVFDELGGGIQRCIGAASPTWSW
jgi:hypothetical protein